MSTSTTVPVPVTPEAADRIAKLGMKADVEQMIAHTLRTVPGLKQVGVVLEDAYDTWDQPYLTIEGVVDQLPLPEDSIREEWGRWQVTTFPFEVCQHITLLLTEGPRYAR